MTISFTEGGRDKEKNMVNYKLFNGKKNVLWGAGAEGKRILLDFITQGIYIDYFCDSNPEKQGLRLFGKKILSPDEVLEHQEDYNIIISTSIQENVCQIQEKLSGVGKIDGNLFYGEDIARGFMPFPINGAFLYQITLQTNKKIVIYGKTTLSVQISYVLEYVDVDTAYFIADDEENGLFHNRPIKSLYSLLEEEEEFLVILPEKSKVQGKKMERLGLACGKDFFFWNEFGWSNTLLDYVLDPSLGYNYIAEQERFPGIVVFGNPNAKLKIVTLGGSTTDPRCYPFKCWPEILSDKLLIGGNDVCVVCGGCNGYQSSQELIKLIRDILPMQPDIVIDYTGVNDVFLNNDGFRFCHSYQIQLFQSISEQINISTPLPMDDRKHGQSYVQGIRNDLSVWEEYEKNIRCMEAICREYGIRYYAFLQPFLWVKEELSAYEKELILNTDCVQKDLVNDIKKIYSHKETTHTNFIDLTEIFDSYDVYLDDCHVTEEGNRLIADAIFEELRRKGEFHTC